MVFGIFEDEKANSQRILYEYILKVNFSFKTNL